MAKGRTNQPLIIWVWWGWAQHPEIQKLRDVGHTVELVPANGHNPPAEPEPDLILHPAAHAWSDEMWDYLDVAIKTARARRRKK